MVEATKQEGRQSLAKFEPFTVELGDDNNRNIALSSLKLRLRGSWSLSRLHQRKQGGRDVGAAMTGMPDIPGMCISVDPGNGRVVVFDPLEDNAELLDRINVVANRATAIKKGASFTSVPSSEHEMNPDTLKTLLAELIRMNRSGKLKAIKGHMPRESQIDRMPGKELFDMWNNGRKPRYVDEVEEWERRVDSQSV